jgi:hypothetical protein
MGEATSDVPESEETEKVAVELFSGQGGVAATFEEKGISTTTVDNDPQMRADWIEDIGVFVRRPRGRSKKDYGWASVCCGSYTRVSDRGHSPARTLEGVAISQRAKQGDATLLDTVKYFKEMEKNQSRLPMGY